MRVLLSGQFGLFTAGNALSLIGTWMQRIAASWLVWDWTGSAFWLGVLAAADLLPVVAVGPFAGVAADRWDRLHQNRLAQVASAAIALALAVLLATDTLGLGLLITIAAVQGVLVAAVQPARLAMVQQMVPREDLTVAVAMNSATVNLARLVGPALAGVLIASSEILWVFLLNAAVTVIFVGILGRLRLDRREGPPACGSLLVQMREGFQHVLRAGDLRATVTLLLLGGILVRSVLELVPAISAQTFTDAATGLAVLTAAAAAGALASGLTVRERTTEQLASGLPWWWLAGALAATVLIQSSSPLVAALAAALTGGAITRCLVATQTCIQLSTPDGLRGRVLSIHGLIARGSPAIGALAIGYAGDRMGLATAVTAAAMCMMACVAAFIGMRAVRS